MALILAADMASQSIIFAPPLTHDSIIISISSLLKLPSPFSSWKSKITRHLPSGGSSENSANAAKHSCKSTNPFLSVSNPKKTTFATPSFPPNTLLKSFKFAPGHALPAMYRSTEREMYLASRSAKELMAAWTFVEVPKPRGFSDSSMY